MNMGIHRASQPLTFTDAAVAHIRKCIAEQEQTRYLRVDVRKAGCSGLKYHLDFVSETVVTDIVCQVDDAVNLYIAADVLDYIKGSVVDYVQEGLNKKLVFQNPNASGTCGCGESFII